jgi:hypothetical protein
LSLLRRRGHGTRSRSVKEHSIQYSRFRTSFHGAFLYLILPSPPACIHISGKSAMAACSTRPGCVPARAGKSAIDPPDPGRNEARRNRCQRGVLLEHFPIPLRRGGRACCEGIQQPVSARPCPWALGAVPHSQIELSTKGQTGIAAAPQCHNHLRKISEHGPRLLERLGRPKMRMRQRRKEKLPPSL